MKGSYSLRCRLLTVFYMLLMYVILGARVHCLVPPSFFRVLLFYSFFLFLFFLSFPFYQLIIDFRSLVYTYLSLWNLWKRKAQVMVIETLEFMRWTRAKTQGGNKVPIKKICLVHLDQRNKGCCRQKWFGWRDQAVSISNHCQEFVRRSTVLRGLYLDSSINYKLWASIDFYQCQLKIFLAYTKAAPKSSKDRPSNCNCPPIVFLIPRTFNHPSSLNNIFLKLSSAIQMIVSIEGCGPFVAVDIGLLFHDPWYHHVLLITFIPASATVLLLKSPYVYKSFSAYVSRAFWSIWTRPKSFQNSRYSLDPSGRRG